MEQVAIWKVTYQGEPECAHNFRPIQAVPETDEVECVDCGRTQWPKAEALWAGVNAAWKRQDMAAYEAARQQYDEHADEGHS